MEKRLAGNDANTNSVLAEFWCKFLWGMCGMFKYHKKYVDRSSCGMHPKHSSYRIAEPQHVLSRHNLLCPHLIGPSEVTLSKSCNLKRGIANPSDKRHQNCHANFDFAVDVLIFQHFQSNSCTTWQKRCNPDSAHLWRNMEKHGETQERSRKLKGS